LLDCIAAVTAVRVCRPGFGGGRGRGRGRGGADGEDGMATVAAVAGGGRWKHDMFEELVRREETGANPEVGCCANQAHCLCAVCVGGGRCGWCMFPVAAAGSTTCLKSLFGVRRRAQTQRYTVLCSLAELFGRTQWVRWSGGACCGFIWW
jgi:hypothetical protein